MAKVEHTPLVLIVLDGFGYSPVREGNAIVLASTPHFDQWYKDYPNTLVEASGQYVGLRPGQMGNSEVGHLNIGAGRIVRMDTSRIDHAIETGEFFHNPALGQAMEHANSRESTLHLMGLVSHGGVHSSQEHLYALLRMAKQLNVGRVFVHAFLDGRDTAPDSGAGYVAELMDRMDEYQIGTVASVVGRYYAMDRDKRWERTEQAYRLLRYGEGRKHRDPVQAIRESYSEGVTDEFVKPIAIVRDDDAPLAPIRNGDSVIFFNFRADRARQITRAFAEDGFEFFDRGAKPDIRFTCMTYYDRLFALPVAFGPEHHDQILADIFAEAGLKNLRIAETEKYAHVTFFFNGGVEPPFPGEERILIPSPKVATYDLKPEMSAREITDEVVKQIASGRFDVVVMNYANADMVGHTGNLEATIKAIEVIDECLGRVVEATQAKGGTVIITADHGNAEQMIDPITGQIFTAHTTNPVPVILIGQDRYSLREGGSLRDIAPTMLGMLGLAKPEQMTGEDLRISERSEYRV
ncbi:MAG TPA: 2,3-bisphosphoglycerate-independent phosphoglycerate mutase [Blastocatellia bacterium]|nr:2,3-bisphosphoglycerate-independent phosphoglycerate mutase [Blastocatellia bacterium]